MGCNHYNINSIVKHSSIQKFPNIVNLKELSATYNSQNENIYFDEPINH